ncbi:MAG: hypothetical protein HY808_10985 [Nitrospirae bacterium]|nr:hypothetical protein [Nitrospirota bacterium]
MNPLRVKTGKCILIKSAKLDKKGFCAKFSLKWVKVGYNNQERLLTRGPDIEKERIPNYYEMNRLIEVISIVALLLLVASAFQCTGRSIQKEMPSDPLYAEYTALEPAGFQKEIEWLLEAKKRPTDATFAVNAHLKLAFLFSHYRNPAPDNRRALKELKTFESLSPEYGRKDFIQNWLRMLEEIVRYSDRNEELRERVERLRKGIPELESANNDLQREHKRLEREIKKLESANKELESENKKITEKLNQLKNIDVELEEKRKQIK